ncbi:hypothetical protein DPMN_000772 [Dreissena polymorpha]|uniref:Uncharacterized protein n=1 Tax=Dreissena polymorpha TaxID=45954 RepID=A0A9D4MGH5_DREPO|nr:hypothetical protein DPMN_000772 [Dreissena polymorpha]
MNIISLHNKILSRFSQEEQETKTTLQTVTDLLSSPLLTEETVRYLQETKEELERRVLIKNAFIVKSTELVLEYMKILNNPLNANIEEKKNTLYQQYVAISSELVVDKKWNIKIQKPLSVQKTVCDVCQNNDPRKFEMDESSKKFCIICSTQHDVLKTSQAVHKDYDRVKIITKVTYSRKVHFHECIKQ